MADQTLGNKTYTGSGSTHGFEKATNPVKTVADQAVTVGRDLKEKAFEVAGTSTAAIKDQASEFVDAAKDVASQATDKLKQTVDGQKTAGAEYVGSLADTMRRAAKEFDGDLPIAGTYIRKAASQVESVADSIKTGNFNDLVRGAQSFARRQPTVFLGLAVLAGFGAVRFLKSSADQPSSAGTGSRPGGSGSRPAAGNQTSSGRFQPNTPSKPAAAGNQGYRDEFTR